MDLREHLVFDFVKRCRAAIRDIRGLLVPPHIVGVSGRGRASQSGGGGEWIGGVGSGVLLLAKARALSKKLARKFRWTSKGRLRGPLRVVRRFARRCCVPNAGQAGSGGGEEPEPSPSPITRASALKALAEVDGVLAQGWSVDVEKELLESADVVFCTLSMAGR